MSNMFECAKNKNVIWISTSLWKFKPFSIGNLISSFFSLGLQRLRDFSTMLGMDTDDLPDCSPEFHEEVKCMSSKFQQEPSLQNETWDVFISTDHTILVRTLSLQ